jgi:hypothetical protein
VAKLEDITVRIQAFFDEHDHAAPYAGLIGARR